MYAQVITMSYPSPLENPIQIFNVLSQTDFERAVTETREYLKKANGFHKKLGLKYSEKSIGVFSKVCDVIANTLNTVGFVSPKITSIDFINHDTNRTVMNFHKHWLNPNISPYEKYSPGKNKSHYNVPFEYFCIAIYYPHKCYQEYSGELTVKLNKDDVGQTFKAVPNSLVIHTGIYGHEVSMPKKHPTELRTASFTHWACEYNP